MDSSQTWLGFSLSYSSSSSNSPSHLPLLEALNATSRPAGRTPELSSGGATELSIFTPSADPKLEDFLGSASRITAPNPSDAFTQFHLEAPPESGGELYDSELKRIAASFLRGLSGADRQAYDDDDNNINSNGTPKQPVAAKKTADTFGQRTSIYRGVTRHRWTGRYEAHLWDNSCRREGQSRKGRQVYLGGYDMEDKAARAYDLAALKYWGTSTTTNFPIMNYEKEVSEMKNMSRQEFVASLRRRSSGFSRGASIYRGVTRHHQHGRWQARIGRVAGNKDLYLGTFSTQEEAAEAYDIAAIKFRGLNAVTNFDLSRYDVKSIARSNLPVGGAASGMKPSGSSPGSGRPDGGDQSSVFSLPQHPAPSAPAIGFAVPVIKPDVHWALFGSSGQPHPKPFLALDPSSPRHPDASDIGLLPLSAGEGGNGGYLHCGGNAPAVSIPYGTPVAAAGYEPLGWVTPAPFHPLQSSKPGSLPVFQTPIFGVE